MGGCGPPKTGPCLPNRCSTPAACPDFIPGFGKECATCWVVHITHDTHDAQHVADVILRCNIHCTALFLDQRVSGPCTHTAADEDRLPIARTDPPGTRLIQNPHSPVPWYNADSQVLNEAELVETMRAFVASRGVPGEELVVFDHTVSRLPCHARLFQSPSQGRHRYTHTHTHHRTRTRTTAHAPLHTHHRTVMVYADLSSNVVFVKKAHMGERSTTLTSLRGIRLLSSSSRSSPASRLRFAGPRAPGGKPPASR